MAPVPTPPKYQPENSKDLKHRMMTESLLTSLKKTYEKPKGKQKVKRANLFDPNITNPDNAFEIWKQPTTF
jgi:hypothetical protein